MKKGAVAGAIVWSAPVLTSSPAFAATGRCSGSKPCTTYYYCKVDSDREEEPSSTADGSGCRTYTVTGANNTGQLGCPGQTGTVQNGCQFVSGDHNLNNSGYFQYDAGVVPVVVQVKYGNNCADFFYDSTSDTFDNNPRAVASGCTITLTTSGSLSTGLRVDISKTGTGSTCPGISHIGTYFCK